MSPVRRVSVKYMKTFTKRKKIIFMVMAGLIGGYLLVNVLIKPLSRQTLSLDDKIASSLRELEKAKAVIREAEVAGPEYERYSTSFRQDGTDEATMAVIIAGIEKTAAEIDLRISDLKPRQVRRDGRFNVFAVALTFDAPLEKITGFLDLLQGKPGYFAIDDMELARQGGKGKTDLRGNVTLTKILIRGTQ